MESERRRRNIGRKMMENRKDLKENVIDIDFESRTRRHNDCSYSPGVATTMSTPDSRFKALLSDSTFVPPKRKIKE